MPTGFYKRPSNYGEIRCKPPIPRFFKFVNKTEGCWLWKGWKVLGYGKFNVKGKRVMAHRFSYEYHKGEIPKGLLVLHDCDTPSCVNPDHLHLGDHSQNLIEAYERGLHRPRGKDKKKRKTTIKGETK